MLNKAQKKLNNKELAKSIGKQLSDARREAGFLLSDISKYYNYNIQFLDILESGLRLPTFYEIIYISSLYNKKIEIKIVDA